MTDKPVRKKSGPPKGSGGRPSKYDLDKEAEDLLKWSLRDDATCLYQFTYDKPYIAEKLDDFARRNENFGFAFKKAKERIGVRREQKTNEGKFNFGVYNRSATIYNARLKQFEDDKRKADKKLDFEYKAKLLQIEFDLRRLISEKSNSTPNDNAIDDLLCTLRSLAECKDRK